MNWLKKIGKKCLIVNIFTNVGRLRGKKFRTDWSRRKTELTHNHKITKYRKVTMKKPLELLGIFLCVVAVGYFIGAGYAYSQVQGGYNSLESFSESQNVQLNYNKDGDLIDRGSTEGAAAIMSLLEDDWNFPVVEEDLDSGDPTINTSSEYMFQMATIAYHVLNGTQTVELTEDVEYNGETFEAGVYEFEVDGRYWTDFDRMHPIEGPAREQAWSGTAHALIAELGVGAVTHSTLQLGLGIAALLAGLGVVNGVMGAAFIFTSRKHNKVHLV